MGQKDMAEKMLEDYNDVFADIVNGLLFDGEQTVHEEELEDSGLRTQYKADTGKLHEQERDTEKYWTRGNGIRIAVYGLENQTKPDAMMPIRVFGYEGADYRSQLLKKKKESIPVPVVTLVLYFGTDKRWDEKSTLKEILPIPEELEPYVNDIRVHVFEISWLSDEQLKRFRSDFRIVANFFVQKRKNHDYIPDDKTEIVHVDAMMKFLSVMTGDSRYEAILTENIKNNPEVHNMCDVAERLENRGRVEGRAEGRAEGRVEGRAEGRAEGRNEGGIQELLGLVNDGFLDRDIAADRAERRYGVKRDEFFQMLSACDPEKGS